MTRTAGVSVNRRPQEYVETTSSSEFLQMHCMGTPTRYWTPDTWKGRGAHNAQIVTRSSSLSTWIVDQLCLWFCCKLAPTTTKPANSLQHVELNSTTQMSYRQSSIFRLVYTAIFGMDVGLPLLHSSPRIRFALGLQRNVSYVVINHLHLSCWSMIWKRAGLWK